MRRPQFSLKTMLWLMAVVGAAVLLASGLGGEPLETEHEVVAEGSPVAPLVVLVAGACLAVYVIRLKR
ncbi:MAG TPA: hypothetical protein VG826_30310 [Pirellulales bacterium]|nr:hypothetical protein [Pirellulales bacterium]